MLIGGGRRGPHIYIVNFTLERVLFAWLIGKTEFLICHGKRTHQIWKRTRCFGVAHQKIEIERVLFPWLIGKANSRSATAKERIKFRKERVVLAWHIGKLELN